MGQKLYASVVSFFLADYELKLSIRKVFLFSGSIGTKISIQFCDLKNLFITELYSRTENVVEKFQLSLKLRTLKLFDKVTGSILGLKLTLGEWKRFELIFSFLFHFFSILDAPPKTSRNHWRFWIKYCPSLRSRIRCRPSLNRKVRPKAISPRMMVT